MANVKPCRFSWECRRIDCWFLHPLGRQIDGSPPPPSGAMPLYASPQSSPQNRGNVACKWGRKCNRVDCYYKHPEGREIDDGMVVPDEEENDIAEIEREMERVDVAAMENLEDHGDEETFFPKSEACECCKGYKYKCTCGDTKTPCTKCHTTDPPQAAVEPNEKRSWAPWKDEWFPQFKDCECCHGYRYRCEAEGCRAKSCCQQCGQDDK